MTEGVDLVGASSRRRPPASPTASPQATRPGSDPGQSSGGSHDAATVPAAGGTLAMAPDSPHAAERPTAGLQALPAPGVALGPPYAHVAVGAALAVLATLAIAAHGDRTLAADVRDIDGPLGDLVVRTRC